MVTGASTADLAVILVDARKGVLTQTRRHSYLVQLLGIRRVVLAINKMDLVEHSEEVFARIETDYREFANRLGIREVTAIPVCATNGDNVVARSNQMPWYQGPTLMEHLEAVAGRRRYRVEATPTPGSARQPPASGVSRLCRRHRQRHRGAWRSNPGAAVRASESNRARADRRPRGGCRRGRSVGAGDARRRARRQSRGRHRRPPVRRRPWPISSKPRSCGCTSARCCRAGHIC